MIHRDVIHRDVISVIMNSAGSIPARLPRLGRTGGRFDSCDELW